MDLHETVYEAWFNEAFQDLNYADSLLDCSKWPMYNFEAELQSTFPNKICDIWKHISVFF